MASNLTPGARAGRVLVVTVSDGVAAGVRDDLRGDRRDRVDATRRDPRIDARRRGVRGARSARADARGWGAIHSERIPEPGRRRSASAMPHRESAGQPSRSAGVAGRAGADPGPRPGDTSRSVRSRREARHRPPGIAFDTLWGSRTPGQLAHTPTYIGRNWLYFLAMEESHANRPTSLR